MKLSLSGLHRVQYTTTKRILRYSQKLSPYGSALSGATSILWGIAGGRALAAQILEFLSEKQKNISNSSNGVLMVPPSQKI